MTTLNIELLRNAVEWVEAQDKLDTSIREWNQGYWLQRQFAEGEWCGTGMCLAGYIGYSTDERFRLEETIEDLGWYNMRGDDSLHVSDYARDALGITEDEAERLFSANNSAWRIRAVASDIAESRGLTL